MNTLIDLQDRILNVNQDKFLDLALEVFDFQSHQNEVYAEFLTLLKKQDFKPKTIEQIPFLPMQLFKYRIIKSGNWKEQMIFESSGTTGSVKSKHFINSLDWYHQVSKFCFEYHYGSIQNYEFVGLLPLLDEKPNSSLIKMVQYFSEYSNSTIHKVSFLNNYIGLNEFLIRAEKEHKKIILFGLSLALLDFVKRFKVDVSNLIVIETGGMKNSNLEIDKEALLIELKIGFPNAAIHSEYGMTELMSQAYASDGIYYSAAPLLNFQLCDPTDPTQILSQGKRGVVNIIDLGNLNTCSFLQTGDLGILDNQQRLQVLGRFNVEEVRGCAQMLE